MNWKTIPNTGGRYEASDTGLVRSLYSQYGLRSKPKIFKLTKTSCGYRRVAICGKWRLVHHLVLEAFVGFRGAEQETRHLDGNPENNRLENICWGTREENIKDKTRHNKRRGFTILTKEQVLTIRNSPNVSNSDFGILFGVTDAAIYCVRKHLSWAWL